MTGSRTRLVLLTLLVDGCDAEHHADQVLTAYRSAIQHNDLAAYARLAAPNLRASVDAGDLKQEDTFFLLDAVLKQRIRTITTRHAVIYLGWEKHTGRANTLWPILVGDGTALRHFGARTNNLPPESTDWQVGMAYGPEWAVAHVDNPGEQARVTTAIQHIDETLLTAWLVEGNEDARKAIQAQLTRS